MVDIFIKDVTFSAVRLAAALLIIVGFGVMLLPDRWNNPIHRVFLCNTSRNEKDEEENRAPDDIEESKSKEKMTEASRF